MASVSTSRLAFAAVISLALASCTTTQAEFQKNPKVISKAALCRTLLETPDPYFRQEVATELLKRQIDPNNCPAMVQQQNQAALQLWRWRLLERQSLHVQTTTVAAGAVHTIHRQAIGHTPETVSTTGSETPLAVGAAAGAHKRARAVGDRICPQQEEMEMEQA